MNTRRTIMDLLKAKQEGQKIVAVSCYDFTTAQLVTQADVDVILVGDSAAQIVLGHDTTLPATMDFMVLMTQAVRKGAPEVCLVADMPFLSYQLGEAEAIRNAGRFVVEAGAQVVKIEVTSAYESVVRAVSDAGISVMAHIGIRPQSILKAGRLKAEGTTAEMGNELIELADRMVEAGAGSLLIEGTASEVSTIITQRVDVPVISCGSGVGCDGQVLISPDILGLTQGAKPKFSRSFASLAEASVQAFDAYSQSVRQCTYPDAAHSYCMKAGEIERLREFLKTRS
ncbi:MAG: 3-methyl-2-oxobutanoate hydroxymethyltransferase [Phycisphaeraceae bacterium]|nr:3-methyl-2-oxobutanoate hydroxymethyltransferase [Phycisphaeraceae bacterium]